MSLPMRVQQPVPEQTSVLGAPSCESRIWGRGTRHRTRTMFSHGSFNWVNTDGQIVSNCFTCNLYPRAESWGQADSPVEIHNPCPGT